MECRVADVPTWVFSAYRDVATQDLILRGHLDQPHESRGVRHQVSRLEMEQSVLGPRETVLASIASVADVAKKQNDTANFICYLQMAEWVREYGGTL